MVSLGKVIGEKYRMLHELGRGGMGTVWVGEHVELSTQVAVKFLDSKYADNDQARKRFQREARAAASIAGKHVVHVFDYGIHDDTPYLVMELLQGETLDVRLDREGSLPVGDVRKIAKQIGTALARAHEAGVVHRDLKPANIFLCDDDDDFMVKLLDFGVAKILEPSPSTELLTKPGEQIGTLYYMSPEQICGSPVDHRTDIWSLSVVVFECLTGELPFESTEGPALVASICSHPLCQASKLVNLPATVDAWFARGMCRDVDERERSARRLAEDFERLTAGLSGRCERLTARRENGPSEVVAYPSTEDSQKPPRFSSSIPAAINGRRDMNHIALISTISRTSAVLWTRQRCIPGQSLKLTLRVKSSDFGVTTEASVLDVTEAGSPRPEMWPYEVEVRFASPLALDDEQLEALASG